MYDVIYILYCKLQSDLEKLEGLPVAPFMDREKVTKPSSQIGFIKFVLLPLFELLGDAYPIITVSIVDYLFVSVRAVFVALRSDKRDLS